MARVSSELLPEGEPEVRELRPPVAAEQDVRRLDVPVDDPDGMEGRQAGEQVGRHPHRLGDGQRPAAQPARQALAVHHLHHQEGAVLVAARVVDPDQVGALEVPGQRRLAGESLERVASQPVGAQELESDPPAAGAVDREVHHSEAAAPQDLDHLVAAGHQGSGRQPLGDRGRAHARPDTDGLGPLGCPRLVQHAGLGSPLDDKFSKSLSSSVPRTGNVSRERRGEAGPASGGDRRGPAGATVGLYCRGPLAQSAEQRTFNPRVQGSIP